MKDLPSFCYSMSVVLFCPAQHWTQLGLAVGQFLYLRLQHPPPLLAPALSGPPPGVCRPCRFQAVCLTRLCRPLAKGWICQKPIARRPGNPWSTSAQLIKVRWTMRRDRNPGSVAIDLFQTTIWILARTFFLFILLCLWNFPKGYQDNSLCLIWLVNWASDFGLRKREHIWRVYLQNRQIPLNQIL